MSVYDLAPYCVPAAARVDSLSKARALETLTLSTLSSTYFTISNRDSLDFVAS